MPEQIKQRLAYLRKQIEQENISYGEILELQSLAEHIDKGDVLLLEWAGVPEFECDGKHENVKAILDCEQCNRDLEKL